LIGSTPIRFRHSALTSANVPLLAKFNGTTDPGFRYSRLVFKFSREALMAWIRLTVFAATVALSTLTASPTDPPFADFASSGPASVKLPPVLQSSEQPDTRQVNLPGPPPVTPALKLLTPIAPVAQMAPIPRKLSPVPALHLPVAVPRAAPAVKPALLRRGPAAPVATSADPAPVESAPVSDMQREIAVFCQKQIGHWTQSDAQKVLGEATRQRPAYDEKQAVNGTIHAFADPSGRYRELELDFDRETGTLRSVFVYPLRLTWQQCRKLWDGPVSAADANQGRKFYSYSNRRLDVLVDPAGKVISLGWY
jgi:hypothetical protein